MTDAEKPKRVDEAARSFCARKIESDQRAVSGESPDMGATISPFAAFQILQGLETLPVCMEQHNANAIVVANYLAGHSKVEKVYFPGLQTGEHRRRADAYLLGGYGALVGFELKDGAEAGKRFIDAIKLIYHVAKIGDARTLAIHPATTTHSQPTEEDQLATGVTQAMCACLSA